MNHGRWQVVEYPLLQSSSNQSPFCPPGLTSAFFTESIRFGRHNVFLEVDSRMKGEPSTVSNTSLVTASTPTFIKLAQPSVQRHFRSLRGGNGRARNPDAYLDEDYPLYWKWVANSGLNRFTKRHNIAMDFFLHVTPVELKEAYSLKVSQTPYLREQRKADRSALSDRSNVCLVALR